MMRRVGLSNEMLCTLQRIFQGFPPPPPTAAPYICVRTGFSYTKRRTTSQSGSAGSQPMYAPYVCVRELASVDQAQHHPPVSLWVSWRWLALNKWIQEIYISVDLEQISVLCLNF